ncbi:MAG: hypothetical protein RMJ88_12630 [Thermogemmata sp.]|nr:hypothetical protein [Thermogemmata sp.]
MPRRDYPVAAQRYRFLAFLVGIGLCEGSLMLCGATAQHPIPTVPASGPIPSTAAPLTYVRFLLPEGVRLTAYPGTPAARLLPGNVRLGLRPGYSYRFELSGLPAAILPPPETQAVLYPEITVYGSLHMRRGLNPQDFPVPVLLSNEDLGRALQGAVIVKYVYLEDPAQALPAATTPDSPLELRDDDETTARQQALRRGRLLITVRLGNRIPTPDELRQATVEHTILLPGMNRLAAPAQPPCFPPAVVPLYDPLVGPRPTTEECFVNGGDRGEPLGIGPRQQLGGLEAGEVAVEYTLQQQRHVTTSNPVAVCAPRFVIRRAEYAPRPLQAVHHLAVGEERRFPLGLHQRELPQAGFHYQRLSAVQSQQRPSLYFNQVGVSLFAAAEQVQAVAQVSGLKVVGVLVTPEQLTAYPTVAPLTVSKQIDPPGARQPGDTITITIRFFNSGNQPLGQLAVTDHLSPRLEYVAESAQTSRAANFSLTPQDDGTVLLRWDFPGDLLPGQGGSIRFKARIR